MPCTTVITDIEELSNGEIRVWMECCGDPSTRSSHTINVTALENAKAQAGTSIVGYETDLNALIQEQVSASEARHRAMIAAKATIEAFKLKQQVLQTERIASTGT